MQALAWQDELEKIAGDATKLSPRARRAVKSVVASILSEGERRPPSLDRMLAALADG